MENADILLNQLTAIIQLAEKGQITGDGNALEKFKTHIGNVKSMASFDTEKWRNEWRREVWKLGEVVRNQNPNQFLNLIDEILRGNQASGREALEFIKSGIEINLLPVEECKRKFENLAMEYPFNPEFRIALGSSFARADEFISALNEFKLAQRIDPQNETFLETRFNEEQRYLDRLIETSEYETAGNYVRDLQSDTILTSHSGVRRVLVDYARRIKEYRSMQEKVRSLEVEFKEKMHSELEHERRRLIEIFGFFAAIVAFLLSTVSIGENFSFVEALYFLIALGIILILFVTSVFTIFSSERTRLKQDKRFWILIAGLVLMLLLILKADTVSKILEQLINK